jgi:hypothetical protein
MEPGNVNVKHTIWASALGFILRLFKAILAVFQFPAANFKQLDKSSSNDIKSRSADRWVAFAHSKHLKEEH